MCALPVQAASGAVASDLRAPSSLAVGAAVPSTKDAILDQSSAAKPSAVAQAAMAKASSAPTASDGAQSQDRTVTQPARRPLPPPSRSLEGLDEAVVKSIKALCQVSMFPCLKT